MHYFEAQISLHGEMGLEENADKVFFTDSLCVYYSIDDDDKCDVVGSIIEVEVDGTINAFGYIIDNKLGDKLARKIRSKKNILKPIFTGVVLSTGDKITKIIIDGFTLENIEVDIGCKIKMVDRVIN